MQSAVVSPVSSVSSVSSSRPLSATVPAGSNSIATPRHAELRRERVVVEHQAGRGVVRLTLRFDERAPTRERLGVLGFRPDAGPPETSISWQRAVAPQDLPDVYRALVEALDGEAVLDVGCSFVAAGRPPIALEVLPPTWQASFVLHVGGTARCVVFDAGVDRDALAAAFHAARDAYFDREYTPASE
jgi:hypothetical protein